MSAHRLRRRPDRRPLRAGAFVFFLSASGLAAQSAYWVPADPPTARYRIEAAISAEAKTISGSETIRLVNSADRPLERLALAWTISPERTLEVRCRDRLLKPVAAAGRSGLSSPLFFDLPAPLAPRAEVELAVTFAASDLLRGDGREYKLVEWYPRLWWDGLPAHDAFSVKIKTPPGYAAAASGLLDVDTGRYEAESVRTFGIYLGRGMSAEERRVDDIVIRAVFTDLGADCARLCLGTAAEAVRFYKDWHGFYPFRFLTIVPGAAEPMGGYPLATGIVVIHGQEKLEKRNPDFWQWITSHEIGHQYWGEYVCDPDQPAWLWIGLGLYADREFTRIKKLSPERHPNLMEQYLNGLAKNLDTTLDIPPAQEARILWDRNNIVVHGKGFSVVSALEVALGRATFLEVYGRCLRDFGRRRLGWKEFRAAAEAVSGRNLAWFFDGWVRSNKYACFQVASTACAPGDGGFVSTIAVRSLGTLLTPIRVRAVFEDGSGQTALTDRLQTTDVLVFRSRARLKEVLLDPDRELAFRRDPLPPNPADLRNEILFETPWTGSGERAKTLYDQARAAKVEDPAVWYRLGLLLFDAGYRTESLEAFSLLAARTAEPLQHFAALVWMGMLKDLAGAREEALRYYRESLTYDTGRTLRHDQFGLQIGRAWVEERLKTPFTWGGKK